MFAALAVAGCTTAPAAVMARVPAVPRPVPSCAWYTPTTEDGQAVTVAVTGSACLSHSLIGWIAAKSGRPWGSTRLLIGTDVGTEFAVAIRRDGSTVRIFERGAALATQATGGFLADDLSAAGWVVEPPGFGA